ncbi:hypothetical protein PHSC3_001680 [Chlamydiales bacterium STE3]|nr:hypothetical protein PHSC3_001680 [Chlamydiales bacterium STE3]
MRVLRNAQKRVYIEGLPKTYVNANGKIVKIEIKGYQGALQNIIGWILSFLIKL